MKKIIIAFLLGVLIAFTGIKFYEFLGNVLDFREQIPQNHVVLTINISSKNVDKIKITSSSSEQQLLKCEELDKTKIVFPLKGEDGIKINVYYKNGDNNSASLYVEANYRPVIEINDNAINVVRN